MLQDCASFNSFLGPWALYAGDGSSGVCNECSLHPAASAVLRPNCVLTHSSLWPPLGATRGTNVSKR
ncbi:hypothetical protein VFPBJ_04595 [Purpureocillium lilacinum]|uniref:Uncharacterized protein n=1 Tax=Purpureocillium lilacinum TaxID=33203 RepID=A0A179GXP9_PURLI|nr:hypothetical protein VFPBJ_04595 [Purpureocillium lilacinum]